jgi:hypothetical protein
MNLNHGHTKEEAQGDNLGCVMTTKNSSGRTTKWEGADTGLGAAPAATLALSWPESLLDHIAAVRAALSVLGEAALA